MIKICSPQLGLFTDSQLGGEVHDVQLISKLCKKGVIFNVLLPRNKSYPKLKNLNTFFLPFSHVFPPHLFNILALPYIISQYKRDKFNILRIHSPYFLGIAAWVTKKLFPNIRIVTTIHLREDRTDLDWILAKTVHVYDHIFTVSEYLKEWVVGRYKISPKKITVIYNGVEESLKPKQKNRDLIAKYGLENKKILLNIGSLIDRKNVLFLINLMKLLIQKNKNLKLIICGSGALKKELQSKINEGKLNDFVLLLDPVFRTEKNEIFNLADIFLFPSKNEGFGLVAGEAMTCGIPVVGANNTSIPEVVIDNKTGFLAKTSDLIDWEKKLDLLIDSPELRDKMGKSGRKFSMKNFTWDKVANKTLKIYEELSK